MPRTHVRSAASIASSTMEVRDMVDAVGEYSPKTPIELLPLPRDAAQTTFKAFEKMKVNNDVSPHSKREAAAETKKPSPTSLGAVPATTNKSTTMTKTIDHTMAHAEPREPRTLAQPLVKPSFKPSVVPLANEQRVFITVVADHRTIYVHPHAKFDEWQENNDKLQRLWKRCEPLTKAPEQGYVLLGFLKDEETYVRVLVTRVRAEQEKVKAEFMVSFGYFS